jgi:hypothetical protein
MEKGSELAGRLLKINDIHPIIKDTLISQQQDIFFLRKKLMELTMTITALVDSYNVLVNANDAMMNEEKRRMRESYNSLAKDEELSNG